MMVAVRREGEGAEEYKLIMELKFTVSKFRGVKNGNKTIKLQ